MKRIKYISIFIVVALIFGYLFQACEDALDSKTYSELAPDNFFKNETDLQVSTAALYFPFSIDWTLTGGLYNACVGLYIEAQEATTDEAWWSNSDYYNFLVGPATFLDGDWRSIYAKSRFVARATSVIANIQKSNVSEDLKKTYIAEAKAVRAYLSYILYDYFGPINCIYDPAQLSSLEPLPRLNADTFKKQMIDDLTEAIPDLIEKTNGTSKWGRFNKNAARAVLMRIYLNDRQWSKAAEMCRDIESNGNYALMLEYKDVFTVTGNNELIYASLASPKAPNYYPTCAIKQDVREANGGLITTPAAGGWGGWYMPWAYYDKYQTGDKRLLTIVAEYTNTKGVLITRANMPYGAMPVKFTNLTKAAGSGYLFDQPIFRLAEVYLSHAEALNELNGPTTEAIGFAQKVTDRAGTSIPSSAKLTKDSFRDFLLDERGRELYMEYVRRTDLIRHGKFISGAKARGKDAKDHQVVFPIPSDVILQGKGVITQNPGY